MSSVSSNSRVADWVLVLRHQWQLLAGSLPTFRDAFDRDDLPLSFILQRDSYDADRRRRRRRATSDPARTRVGGVPTVHLAEHRADARSTLGLGALDE
jgi:hypothetical protein